MQDNWQEFDKQLGDMLREGEEKAPRRVWRAVSSRINEAPAVIPWWQWAAPAFAVAALALGLVLSGTFKSGDAVPGAESIVAQTIQTQTPSGQDESAFAVDESYLAEAREVSGSVPSYSTRKVRVSSPSSTAGEDNTRPGTENLLAEAEDTSAPAGENQQNGNPSPSEQTSEDNSAIWSSIENEDAASRQKVTLQGVYAQGGVGGNDSNIKYGGTGISRMAPGAGSETASIGESGSSTYGVPFTLGLGARFRIKDKLSLGTGLEYSLLTRTFTGTYSDSYVGGIAHTVQFVGVPVNVYYDLFQTRDGLMNIYTWGGGSAEICVGNSYRLMSAPGTVIPDKAGALQFSAALGLGLEFRLSDKLGLYIDPAVRYYFHGNAPKSVRTDKPFMFNFEAGLRFNL